MRDGSAYKSAQPIEGVFCRAMSTCLIASGLAFLLRGLDLYLLDSLRVGSTASEAYLALTDLVWTLLNVVYTAALIGTVVTLSWWVSRMIRNTELLAGARIRSAWWSWVWFWVPGPCLYRPIDTVSELFTINRIGRDRVRGQAFTRAKVDRKSIVGHKPALVIGWWVSVLAWTLFERVGEAMIVYGPTSAIGLPANWGVYAAMGGNVLGVTASILGIEVVRRIGTLQREWEERIPRHEQPTERGRALRVSPLRSEPGESAA